MKILLTGGAGFIGSHLAESLLAHGQNLIIFDNFNDFYDPQLKLKNVQKLRRKGEFILYREDLLNRPALEQIFKTHRPEVVIHLAAYAGVRPSLQGPALYAEVNITGTTHLLELAREYGLQNFIFGSSSSVYGINSKVPFHEDDTLEKPISPYAATKRAAELLCFVYHHNYQIPITCLRFLPSTVQDNGPKWPFTSLPGRFSRERKLRFTMRANLSGITPTSTTSFREFSPPWITPLNLRFSISEIHKPFY